MKNQINLNWISADVQAYIYLPPISFVKNYDTEERQTNIIKVKIQRNPESTKSGTYEVHMKMFENGKLEDPPPTPEELQEGNQQNRNNYSFHMD